MDKYEKKAFLAEYSALQKSLDPSPLVAEMVSAGLVTENQLDDITETATASAKTVKLLEIVRKHGNSRVFELFMKCIEDADEAQKYLADRLRDALQNARLPLAQQESCGRDEDSGQPQGQPRNEQQEPNFEDLKDKPSQIQLLDYVVKKVTSKVDLQSFSLRIGLTDEDISVALADNPNSIQAAVNAVLMVWYRGKGKPRTWTTLVTAFYKMDMTDYAEELAEKIRSKNL
jgi:hypothetical protein